MRLSELLASDIDPDPEISTLAYDSRRVQAGALFFCVSGFERDGHDFAAEALAAGASALVVERRLGLGAPEVLVPSARAAMGPAAARFYGDPTTRLRVVGITGTNGKTTTAYLVRALIEATGERCGLLGTVKSAIAGEERPAARTTPEAIDLQADFRAMLDGGEGACAMEVSSHALALGRVQGVHFAVAIFTNLTQDHLDFHPTMEDYFQAKRLLFADSRADVSVVNVGDRYGRRLADELSGARRAVLTFAVDAEADYRASDVRCDFAGSRFRLHTPAGKRDMTLPLPGRFNVANALGALAAVHALGGGLDVLVAALEEGVRVPGRFEPVEEGQGFAVVVDYAHTPDSLENVLSTARELARPRGGRVLCVFGAGGDRDAAKRPLMGAAAARLADVAIVTSDNPRSEDPEAIVAQVVAGARQARGELGQAHGELGQAHAELGQAGGELGQARGELGQAGGPPGAGSIQTEADRRAAIELAVGQARPGDVLVIAGKGHEQGQELAGGRKIPFDDVTVAREALRKVA